MPYLNLPHIEVMKPISGSIEDLDDSNFDAQIKFDGSRGLLFKNGSEVHLIGRSYALLYDSYLPEIIEESKKLPIESCILDGEITFFDSNGKDTFLTVLANKETRKDLKVVFMVFDILELNREDIKQLPFEKRMELLNNLIPSNLEHIALVSTYPNSTSLYKEVVLKGHEGLVLKLKGSQYINGRSSAWKKVKRVVTEECLVVGCSEGKGSRNDLFGSLILAQETQDGRLIYVGKTSGFNDSEMQRLYSKMNQLKLDNPLNIDIPNNVKVKFWCKPEMIVEVRFGNKTDKEHLRFPVYIRERTDKNPSECLTTQTAKEHKITRTKSMNLPKTSLKPSILSEWLNKE